MENLIFSASCVGHTFDARRQAALSAGPTPLSAKARCRIVWPNADVLWLKAFVLQNMPFQINPQQCRLGY